MQRIKVVESEYLVDFENEVNELLESGYKILATDCGRVRVDKDYEYDNRKTIPFYTAILITI